MPWYKPNDQDDVPAEKKPLTAVQAKELTAQAKQQSLQADTRAVENWFKEVEALIMRAAKEGRTACTYRVKQLGESQQSRVNMLHELLTHLGYTVAQEKGSVTGNGNFLTLTISW